MAIEHAAPLEHDNREEDSHAFITTLPEKCMHPGILVQAESVTEENLAEARPGMQQEEEEEEEGEEATDKVSSQVQAGEAELDKVEKEEELTSRSFTARKKSASSNGKVSKGNGVRKVEKEGGVRKPKRAVVVKSVQEEELRAKEEENEGESPEKRKGGFKKGASVKNGTASEEKATPEKKQRGGGAAASSASVSPQKSASRKATPGKKSFNTPEKVATPDKSGSERGTPGRSSSGKGTPKSSLLSQSPRTKSSLSPRTPSAARSRLFPAKGTGTASNSPVSEDEHKGEEDSAAKSARVKIALVDAYLRDGEAVLAPDSPDIGPTLLKLAKSYHATGERPHKAQEYARHAVKFFESKAQGKANLDLVLSLHILGALHCRLGQYEEAIPVLERSLTIPDLEQGLEHFFSLFAGHMQLGDTYSLMGNHQQALQSYHEALKVQKQALGDSDARFGETCRYVAEAHVQAMQFEEAEELCQHVLRNHGSHTPPGAVEQSADRRLMALIYSGKGDYEKALEHLEMASATLLAGGEDAEAASVENTIGDTYLAMGRHEDAVTSYQKALAVLKSAKGENDASVAAVYVSLAELYLTTGKLREAKTYCENALKIYGKNGVGLGQDDIATGLTEVGAIYEAINEREQALHLLQKALHILDSAPGQQTTAAGIQAQMGVMYYVSGKYAEALNAFKAAVLKLKSGGEQRNSLLGLLLNQMGLACVELYEIDDAADIFEEAKAILDESCGPRHPDTLGVCTNLAGTYDAQGRSDEAIKLLEFILEVKEERLGTAHPDITEERAVLLDMLRAVGRSRRRKSNTLKELLDMAHDESKRFKEEDLSLEEIIETEVPTLVHD